MTTTQDEAIGRLSRVRLDAYGSTPDVCSRVMHDHAQHIEELLGVLVSRGEEVIERSVEEPDGCLFAYKGRLLLHPDISSDAEANLRAARLTS